MGHDLYYGPEATVRGPEAANRAVDTGNQEPSGAEMPRGRKVRERGKSITKHLLVNHQPSRDPCFSRCSDSQPLLLLFFTFHSTIFLLTIYNAWIRIVSSLMAFSLFAFIVQWLNHLQQRCGLQSNTFLLPGICPFDALSRFFFLLQSVDDCCLLSVRMNVMKISSYDTWRVVKGG